MNINICRILCFVLQQANKLCKLKCQDIDTPALCSTPNLHFGVIGVTPAYQRTVRTVELGPGAGSLGAEGTPPAWGTGTPSVRGITSGSVLTSDNIVNQIVK